MTSIPPSEFARARRWRESLDLDQAELGEQIGYSRMSVYWFEKGKTPPVKNAKYKRPVHDRKINPWVWHRYKLACAGFAAQLASRKKFDWQ